MPGKLQLDRIIKTIREDISHGHALVVSGMLFLIFAQLTWWLVFFELNQRKAQKLLAHYHMLFQDTLSGNLNPEKYEDLLEYKDGKYNIRSEISKVMQEEHQKYLIMLISETSFTLLIISYGSFRVIRSIRRERKLVHERNIFMNSVSHELKTPLSTILLNLQTLLKRPGLSEKDRVEMLHEGIEGVKRLEDQVNNLLLGGEILRNKGKFGKPHLSSDNDECDAVKTINKYMDEHHIFFSNHNVSLHMDIPDYLNIRLSCDLFYKVISNLMGNAVQYSGENPDVTLELKLNPDHSSTSLLIVSDRGNGIPEDELTNIFKPLYRLNKTTGPIRGTGMGLYIVREIVHSCGGSITAFSEDEKPGTRFEVRLPLV